MEVGVLAASGEVDALAESLQELVADVGARDEVTVQVRGLSRPDLEALEWAPLSDTDELILLWGVLPERPTRPLGGSVGTPRHATVRQQPRRGIASNDSTTGAFDETVELRSPAAMLALLRIKSGGQAQRFLTVDRVVQNFFRLGWHLLRADNYRSLRTARSRSRVRPLLPEQSGSIAAAASPLTH